MGRCRISRACHRCSRHRRLPDGRRPAAARMTHNFSIEVQQNVGFNTVVTAAHVANASAAWSPRAIGTWCPRARASTRERRSDQRDRRVAAGRLPAAYSSVHNRDRANERRGHRLRLHAGDGEPSPQRGLAFGTAYAREDEEHDQRAHGVSRSARAPLRLRQQRPAAHLLQGSWNMPNGSHLWNSAVGRASTAGRSPASASGGAAPGRRSPIRRPTPVERHHGRRRSGPRVDGLRMRPDPVAR